ncbi:hypothetical protein RRG08_029976 [Elysia crispata]|uniref:Uncharacterized protein n=1 Tax=Elysia crispata TaxID=231223 RepID=A0AAE1DI55_9GAST|nr:hypothetical protein RRG08_029976 [Elysia crispata]
MGKPEESVGAILATAKEKKNIPVSFLEHFHSLCRQKKEHQLPMAIARVFIFHEVWGKTRGNSKDLQRVITKFIDLLFL